DDLELPSVRTSPAIIGPRTDLASLQPHTSTGNLVIPSEKESLRQTPTVPDSPAPGAIATRTTAAESGERSENDRASCGDSEFAAGRDPTSSFTSRYR